MREMEAVGSTGGGHCLLSLQGPPIPLTGNFKITSFWVCLLNERVDPKCGRFCEALTQSGSSETTDLLSGREPKWW